MVAGLSVRAVDNCMIGVLPRSPGCAAGFTRMAGQRHHTPVDMSVVNLFYVLAAVAFGALGFFEARRFAASNGKAPWGWPPAVWAVLLGASLLVGGLLLIIARRTTPPVPAYPVPRVGAIGTGEPGAFLPR